MSEFLKFDMKTIVLVTTIWKIYGFKWVNFFFFLVWKRQKSYATYFPSHKIIQILFYLYLLNHSQTIFNFVRDFLVQAYAAKEETITQIYELIVMIIIRGILKWETVEITVTLAGQQSLFLHCSKLPSWSENLLKKPHHLQGSSHFLTLQWTSILKWKSIEKQSIK